MATKSLILDTPINMAKALAEIDPEVGDLLETCVSRMLPVVQLAISSHSAAKSHAGVVIANQCFNDFLDLCFDLLTCRGRSALRESRAIFEHLVNFRGVTTDPDLAERYELHAAVAAQIEAEAGYGLGQLSGNELKAARHTNRKLGRDSKADFDHAITQYGPSFRRDWAGKSLYDRTFDHRLGGEYDFYRLASTVLHGSAGGSKGTLSDAYERPVHRTGPAVMLCSLSYLKGIGYFRLFIDDLEDWLPHDAGKKLTGSLDAAIAHWPTYRRAIHKLDRELWPEVAPRGVAALLAIDRQDNKKWYFWDRDGEQIVEANPPSPDALSADEWGDLDEIFSLLPPPERRQEPITINVAHVHVTPRIGATWQPESEIINSREQGGYFAKPRILKFGRDET